ncbi:MAG: hypothetical protein AVDCRST_MAG30-4261 [uncultured Solirubrobacteraceae bacterium]|uniref:Superoxide dismutase n=1 Tax=uncultured Solirubrobacteraceae bacterium TaxID=1162706 RepID=A0A6J4TZ81_9ACTN|nr:MAG: hypothetical protein AVDCRST_MAG30-4261 [uncultured Solirubrobacteraceae bacterium]
MHSKIRSAVAATTVVLLAGCGSGGGAGDADRPDTLVVPGARTFPEGVAADARSGDLYVGSTTDGTIYRAPAGGERFEPYLPAGGDGRTAATGLKVDARGRLFVAGRSTGRAFVYDLRSRRLLRRLDAPGRGRALVNDVTVTPEAAYFTDSYRPVVYRVALTGGRIGAMEPWLDLRETPIPAGSGFGLNGIVATRDGRHLLTVHFDTGRLYRVDTRTRAVRRVDLGRTSLRTGDGLLLAGRVLLAVREEPGDVVAVRLSRDLLRGTAEPGFGRDALDFPTTIAEHRGALYVVNSQLDRAPDRGSPPFTVTRLRAPAGLLE